MPSLHKRTRSPYWIASYQDSLGRWLKKSTKATDKALAMKIALSWEEAEQAAKGNRLVESQVRRVMSEIFEKANKQPLHFYTCRDWFTEWLAGKDGATAPRTLMKYKQVTNDFLEHLGDRAKLNLNAITISDVRSFRDALTKGGHSPSTVNQTVRKVLSAPFMAALRLGYITVNPCAGVEALKDGADTEKDFFTPEQLVELCKAAEGDWKGAIIAGYSTGLRLKDITELRWESIDLETGSLKVKTAKTGKIVEMILTEELASWLRSRPRGIAKAPVFPSLAGKSGAGKSGLSMQFKRIMEKAKIKGRVLRAGKGKGRTQSSLSFHSLRHTFNSALAKAGVPQEIRQKLTGHSSAAMNNIYTHHEMASLRDAVSKLPKIGA